MLLRPYCDLKEFTITWGQNLISVLWGTIAWDLILYVRYSFGDFTLRDHFWVLISTILFWGLKLEGLFIWDLNIATHWNIPKKCKISPLVRPVYISQTLDLTSGLHRMTHNLSTFTREGDVGWKPDHYTVCVTYSCTSVPGNWYLLSRP